MWVQLTYTLTGGGRLPASDPASPATVFFLPTTPFHQLQWAPLGRVAPLSGTPEAGWRASGLVGWLSETCEAGWRASSLVGWLSETCEAGWRASSLVGSGCSGGGSASDGTPSAVRRGDRWLPPVAMLLCQRPWPAEDQPALSWSG